MLNQTGKTRLFRLNRVSRPRIFSTTITVDYAQACRKRTLGPVSVAEGVQVISGRNAGDVRHWEEHLLPRAAYTAGPVAPRI